jgi:Cu-Zn family superoxide dismutase
MTIARVAGCLNNPGRNQEGEMMKRVRMRWVATAGLVAAAGCGGVAQQGAESPTPRTFSVPIYDAQAQQVGQLTVVQQTRDSVHLTVEASHLPAGTHGTHLHAAGVCEGPGFTSAGPHLNPLARKHGLRNPEGPHLGDLPNLIVGANGAGRMDVMLAASLLPGHPPLFDADGTALVVHAAADDMMTEPSGNSGARIACGILAAPAAPAR